MIVNTNSPKKQLGIRQMIGLLLLLFRKNGYCANEAFAVLEIAKERVEQYRNYEPIEYIRGGKEAKEITAFREEAVHKFLSECLTQKADPFL